MTIFLIKKNHIPKKRNETKTITCPGDLQVELLNGVPLAQYWTKLYLYRSVRVASGPV